MNYADLIILVVVALFAYMGYLRGFIRDFLDLAATLGAIVLSIFGYSAVGKWLTSFSQLSENLSMVMAFFFIWFAVMLAYYTVMIFFYDRMPEKLRASRINSWFGLAPGFIRGGLFAWFTINLLFIVSLSGASKSVLSGSFFAQNLSKNNKIVSDFLVKTFGSTSLDAARFLTVSPQSNEALDLGFKTTDVNTDAAAAQQMLVLLNKEREDNGEKKLVFDDRLATVGVSHAKDMFAKGYFSHYDQDGKSPFERMDGAKIFYMVAGENLALAPTLAEAFAGLMASPGHRANMLSSDFGKVGIGVVDGGIYGKIFVQEFTN